MSSKYAKPGNENWLPTIEQAKQAVKEGSTAELLYNQFQNVPIKYLKVFFEEVGVTPVSDSLIRILNRAK